MKPQPCSNVTHPRAEPTAFRYETPKARFVERICTVCGRTQGIARIAK